MGPTADREYIQRETETRGKVRSVYNTMTTRKFKRQAGGAFEAAETFEFFSLSKPLYFLTKLQVSRKAVCYRIWTGDAWGGGWEIRRRIKGENSNGRQDVRKGNLHMLCAGGGRHFDSQYHPKWERGKYDNVCLPEYVGEGGGLHERSVSGGVWPSASVVHQSFPLPSMAGWLGGCFLHPVSPWEV